MAARRAPAKKSRSSGASRRGSGKSSGGAPVWVWLVTGLFTGLFVAFLIFLDKVDDSTSQKAEKPAKSASNAPGKAEKSPAKETAAAKSGGAATKEEPPKGAAKEGNKSASADKAVTTTKSESTTEKPALNYDFYKILPKSEVVVPEEELRKPATTAAVTPGTYYLQVGAFRRIEEADGRKAELAMLGIVSSIQTVTVEPNNSWHRVRVGPVKDARQLDKAKRQLQENNISFVTLKENR